MENTRIAELKDFYLQELTQDIIPFWEKHGVDPESGGFYTFLDRKGDLLSTRKTGSSQGRGLWLFSHLIRDVEESRTWLALASGTVRFIRKSLRRPSDGRVFAEITAEGPPSPPEDSLEPELWIASGLAAYAGVSGDTTCLEEARELYTLILNLEKSRSREKESGPAVLSRRFMSGMIRLCRELILADRENEKTYRKEISNRIKILLTLFTDTPRMGLLEYALPDGGFPEGPGGRLVSPGGSLETIGLLLDESVYSNNSTYREEALKLLSWTLELGWDPECGGFYTFVDIEGRQPLQLEWDMKTWDAHCSGIYTLLKAHTLTDEPLYETWFETVQEYSWDHFPDREYGEWFGYLRRDGTVQLDLKGNRDKSLYYLPSRLLEIHRCLKKS